jgi:adenylate cyclase
MRRSRKDPFAAGNGRTLFFFAALTVTAAFLTAYAIHPRLLDELNHKIYDNLLTSVSLPQTADRVAIVAIDEKSLRRFGQWPWPRYRMAQLVEGLFNAGASTVALDMVFAEPDRTSLSRLAREMGRDLGVTVRFHVTPGALLDNDRILAVALQRGTSVLGYGLVFDPKTEKPSCPGKTPAIPVLLAPDIPDNAPSFHRASRAVCNIPVLAQAASTQGFFNIRPDSDGILRRAPLVAEYAGSVRPSLALAALNAAGRQNVLIRVSPQGEHALFIDALQVPLDETGALLIRFRGPSGRIPYISAADVLGATLPAQILEDRIVLVGSTAAGLKDIHATPYDSVFAGVEVHAHILDNLLSGDFLHRPSWMAGAEALALGVSGTATAVLFITLGPLFGMAFAAAGSLSLWIGAGWCLASKGWFFSPLYPLLTLLTNFALLSVMKYYREEKKVRAKTRELSLVQEVTIETVANVAETRDPETGGHIKRTQHYVRALAAHLQRLPKYKTILTDDFIEVLYRSAPLHDLGKVGVPDTILLKPGRLTKEEFERMKLHTTYAYNIISAAEQRLGNSSFLRTARELAHTHQEKWDGSGYPRGLKGEEIPLAGRLMAIADVYDALISRRPYKDSMPHDQAVRLIAEGRNTHFDPEMVDAFLAIEKQFRQIADRFADPSGALPP